MRGGVELQRGVEGKDNLCAGGEFLLAIVLEPPDGGGSSAHAQTNAGSNGSGDDGPGNNGSGGGEADGCGCLAGVSVAHNRAFVIHVGVGVVVEVGDFGADGIDGAVGQADGVRLETDGGGTADAAATVDVGDAAVDDASGGK